VYHVSQLKPDVLNPFPRRTAPPLSMELVNGNEEWVVEEIVDSKWHRSSTRCPLRYKVHWLGYQDTLKYESWVSAISAENSTEAVMEFHSRHPDKPGLEFFPLDWKNKRRKRRAEY
jgi:hypothetical protein